MLITLWGKAWSWKWTVSKILAEKLWYEIIAIWDMRRELAKQMWLNIHEFNKLWDNPENAKEFDIKYEEFQKGLDLNSNIILDSRLGFYAQPNAFKILLDVSEEIAWERIYNAERDTDKQESLQAAIEEVHNRNKLDFERYIKLYNIDVRDQENYDLVIDTWDKTPEQVANIILEKFKKPQSTKERHGEAQK